MTAGAMCCFCESCMSLLPGIFSNLTLYRPGFIWAHYSINVFSIQWHILKCCSDGRGPDYSMFLVDMELDRLPKLIEQGKFVSAQFDYSTTCVMIPLSTVTAAATVYRTAVTTLDRYTISLRQIIHEDAHISSKKVRGCLYIKVSFSIGVTFCPL